MQRLSIFFMVLIFIAGCSTKQDNQTQTVKAVIALPTMKCEMCAGVITTAVKTLDGVQEVTVDKDTKQATVVYVTNKLDKQTIEHAIANAGYDADTVKRNETAFNGLSACCQVPRQNGQ